MTSEDPISLPEKRQNEEMELEETKKTLKKEKIIANVEIDEAEEGEMFNEEELLQAEKSILCKSLA
jgi:hypothetical protein